ncbi:hypothetical protein BRN10_02025, partial [Xanthomonas oryzae pv. oryzae]
MRRCAPLKRCWRPCFSEIPDSLATPGVSKVLSGTAQALLALHGVGACEECMAALSVGSAAGATM